MNDDIRPLEERDIDQVVALQALCFPSTATLEERRRRLLADPYLDLPLSLGRFVDGRLVSSMRFPRRRMWLGPATLDIAAVCDVCTDPEARRQGYASDLVCRSLPIMARLGMPAAMLFGFEFGFYRRLGWEIAANYWTAFLSNTAFPQGTTPAVHPDEAERFVRPFVPSDLSAIADLQAEAVRGEPGALLRSRAWWEDLFQRGEYACTVWDQDGVQGYALYRVVERFRLPSPLGAPPWQRDQAPQRQVEVAEIVAAISTAAQGLASYLHGRIDRTGRITFLGERHIDLLRFGLLQPGAELHCGASFMFRVVDLVPALQALDLPRLPGEEIALSVDDPHVETATRATITWTPDGGREVTAGLECEDRITCDAPTLAQIFAGYRSAGQLHGEGRLHASSRRALAKADLLFPRGEPFLPMLDVF